MRVTPEYPNINFIQRNIDNTDNNNNTDKNNNTDNTVDPKLIPFQSY